MNSMEPTTRNWPGDITFQSSGLEKLSIIPELSELREPVNREGERNFDCPFYENCLEVAAIDDWDFFSCGKCLFLYFILDQTN